MKIEKVLILLFITGTLFCYSQKKDTIKGKLFASESFYENFNPIIVKERNTKESVIINNAGEFKLIPRDNKKFYNLFFIWNGDTIRKYKYKKEWPKEEDTNQFL